MCGIVTIFAYGDAAPSVEQEELTRIREAMLPRGPDGVGLWLSSDRRVGLAHRRLAIIDLSDAGAQPMATKDEHLHLVFNGEIYNYRALRNELEKQGHHFFSNSDTEVLLHLYREKGREMVHHLRGMYAFAVYDATKKGIFLARDPFGIKPLYYANDGQTLRVASQVKALLQGGQLDATPEPSGHVGFFLWGYVPEPSTLYKQIHAFPAGSTLWIDRTGHCDLRSFYNIAAHLGDIEETVPFRTRTEIQEQLRAALVDSVKHHMVADVPVGIFLSAGLDSTTLAALAAEVAATSLRAITLGFKNYQGTVHDETPGAETVARHYGLRQQTQWITRSDFQAHLNSVLAAMDQPSIDGVNSYFVSKAAAEAGLKVALAGQGGDELFGGYPSFRQIPSLVDVCRWLPLPQSCGKAFRWLSAPLLRHFTSAKYASLLEYGGTYGGAYLLRRGLFMPWELPELLDGEMVREGWRELQPLMRLEETIHGVEARHLRIAALEMTWYLRSQLLRDADWAGMAHSVEIRVPFVDVELLRRLAPLLVLRHAPTKKDMASVPARPLPEELQWRPKTGFTVPIHEWLSRGEKPARVGGGLREWAYTVYQAQACTP